MLVAGSRKDMVIIMSVNSNKHMSLNDRAMILQGIINGASHKAIADTIGKDKSTVGREIKKHRTLSYRCELPVECAIYTKCRPGHKCIGRSCIDFVQFTCKRRDRSPGACNGCEKINSCRFNKYTYVPKAAQAAYEYTLSDARSGRNLTAAEAKQIADIIRPLLQQGQSPYQIALEHPEIGITERTLYTYIEDGTLGQFGIGPLDLRRQVSRRLPKKRQNEYKKRNDYSYLQGRKYPDYLDYIHLHPDASVVQMDTVYNNVTDGPFIQTFKFLRYGFLFAVYHTSRTGADMVRGVDLLHSILGPEIFRREVSVLLTDRGREFTLADQFEHDDQGNIRTRVFYCDPMASNQKGSVENMHIELRYILPKEVDLYDLGLVSQEKLNLALSHVNSSPKEALNGKSPWDLMSFLSPDLYSRFIDFGLVQIERDTVVLKPYLLK